MPSTGIQNLLEQFNSVFQEALGTYGLSKIYVEPKARPRFFKTKTVPIFYESRSGGRIKKISERGYIGAH